MRLISILVLATLGSGCLPIPESTKRTTGRTLGKLVVDKPGPVELLVDRDDRTVIVSASRNYRCESEVVDHVEIATSTKAQMIGTTDGEAWGWWLLFPMVLAYPVGVGDLVIANAVALLVPDSIERKETVAGVLRSECRAPARTNVYVALASGQEMQAFTDQHGIAAFVLPAGEDPRTVHVRSDEPAAPEPEPEPEVIVDGVIILPNEHEPTATSTPPPPPPSPRAATASPVSRASFGSAAPSTARRGPST